MKSGGTVGPWLGALSLLALLPFLAGTVPLVRFVRERIDITLESNEMVVSGHYVYKNPWPVPVTQGFTVPFPVDADHPMPTELMVAREAPSPAPIPVAYLMGRPVFELRFGPKEEIRVAVRFRQRAVKRDGCYLLTTTRPWRRPLESAVYTLRGEGVAPVWSNYALERKAPGLWAFERTRFMPPADWRFSWETVPVSQPGG